MDVGYDSIGKWLLPIHEFVEQVKDRPISGHHEERTS
jgi:hypothetical protein